MSRPAPERLLAGFLLAILLSLVVASTLLLGEREAPPQISGVLLSEPRALEPFRLLDHRGRAFTNADLEGRWHLVTYGFTTCPDVCPTTLTRLVDFSRHLGEGDDLQIVFYSVDFRRDTPEQLASYLPFFDPGIKGLTYRAGDGEAHLNFERSLGIRARLVPVAPEDGGDATLDSMDYEVVHGLTLFLLNPRGELQATFDPTVSAGGFPAHDAEGLAADYLAVRRYLAQVSG